MTASKVPVDSFAVMMASFERSRKEDHERQNREIRAEIERAIESPERLPSQEPLSPRSELFNELERNVAESEAQQAQREQEHEAAVAAEREAAVAEMRRIAEAKVREDRTEILAAAKANGAEAGAEAALDLLNRKLRTAISKVGNAVQAAVQSAISLGMRPAPKNKGGRPPVYEWGALIPQLQDHVTKNGQFVSRVKLHEWITDNVKMRIGHRPENEPDPSTVKDAAQRHGLYKIAGL